MRIFFYSFVLLVAQPAFAQRPLTLDEALHVARERSRDLAAARARLDQARTTVTQAWAALLPNAGLQGKYTHNYKEVTLDLAQENQGLIALADIIKATSGNPVQNGALNQFEQQLTCFSMGGKPTANGGCTGGSGSSNIVIQKQEQLDFVVSVTLPLVVPWAYPALQAAKKNVAAAQANYGVSEQQILLGVAQAFFACAGADALVIARKHAIEVAKQTVDNAQARLEAGVVNRVEVTRAQIALLRAEQAARETEDLRVQTYRALQTLIVLHEPFVVASAGEPAAPTQSAEELAQSALRLRPEFIAYQRTIDALSSQAASGLWRWAPTLSAFGNARAFNYPGFSGDNYAWAVGLQLDWVIYDGGVRDAQRALANAQRRENEYKLLQLKDTVVDDVEVARRALETKRQGLDTARRSVDLSKETLDLVRVQHDAGTATQLDLLQAQDNLVASEVAVAQAKFDLDLSTLQLKQKAGLFPEADK
jgi:outer membrane protein TolC